MNGVLHSESIPKLSGKTVAWALVPSYVTGVCITIFCIGVWIAALSPEIPWAYRQHFQKVGALV
jgi:hypothetical protein